MAEKEGFEPSIPFWGIHDFQSCALGQLRDFSMRLLASCRLTDSFDMILQVRPFVKLFFLFFHFFPDLDLQWFYSGDIVNFD